MKNHLYHERVRILFLLEKTLDTDLPSLLAMLLPYLLFVDSPNALYSLMVFHMVLILVKELILQQMKHINGPMLTSLTMESTGVMLKLLA